MGECGNVSRGDCSGMWVVAIEDVLFPGIDVRVTAVHATADAVAVEAGACGRPPDCPSCGQPERRVHRAMSGQARRMARSSSSSWRVSAPRGSTIHW